MKVEYFKTNLGIVVKDNCSIRLKSSYKKQLLSKDEFNASFPTKISKQEYLKELNAYFKNSKFEWTYDGNEYKKLDNFEIDENCTLINYIVGKDVPFHSFNDVSINNLFIVLYHGRLYYTFMSGNYYPQMQLIDFHTKQLTSKWTNIKNLAPVFNKTTKKII